MHACVCMYVRMRKHKYIYACMYAFWQHMGCVISQIKWIAADESSQDERKRFIHLGDHKWYCTRFVAIYWRESFWFFDGVWMNACQPWATLAVMLAGAERGPRRTSLPWSYMPEISTLTFSLLQWGILDNSMGGFTLVPLSALSSSAEKVFPVGKGCARSCSLAIDSDINLTFQKYLTKSHKTGIVVWY